MGFKVLGFGLELGLSTRIRVRVRVRVRVIVDVEFVCRVFCWRIGDSPLGDN